MNDILIAPATVEPFTVAQAKLHIRGGSVDAEDDLITRWIAAARATAEKFMTKAIVLQSRRLVLDCFPGCIEIEWAPLRAVQSIQYLDELGALQTLAADQYRIDKYSRPARITPAYGVTWPTPYDVVNSVLVNYTVGMLIPFTADQATDVLTAPGHGFADADITQVGPLAAGVLPTGLAVSTNYHVRDASADTLKLAASVGGSAIDISGAGTAPNVLGVLDKDIEAGMLLLIADLEQNRAEVITGTIVQSLPRGFEALLDAHRFTRF